MKAREIDHCVMRVTVAGLLAAAWMAPAAAQDDARLKLGKELFGKQGALPACAVCHKLKDAGAEGAVGPSLDELKPDRARVAKALRDGIGQMPSYRGTLSDDQIAALAAYVARATGGEKP